MAEVLLERDDGGAASASAGTAATVRAADGRVVAWIDERLARAAYARLAAEHGGPAAAADRVRLAAALAWPRTVAAFAERPPRLSLLAAAYASAVARIRPFREGNDAMACLLSMLFLRINGAELPAPPLEKYSMFAALADRRVDTVALAQWMRMRHLANQRGVDSVVAIRIRDGRVRGVATMKGSATRLPGVAAGKTRTQNRTQNPRRPTP